MKTVIPLLIPILAVGGTACADPPPDSLVSRLTSSIHRMCHQATVSVANGVFTAKTGTMVYTLHGRPMTGEIGRQTYREEGPNYMGFVLTVHVEKGLYKGQAIVPQELHGPYYPTFINDPPADDGRNHYVIAFSYGSRLDARLKKAIFYALPKTIVRPAGASASRSR